MKSEFWKLRNNKRAKDQLNSRPLNLSLIKERIVQENIPQHKEDCITPTFNIQLMDRILKFFLRVKSFYIAKNFTLSNLM